MELLIGGLISGSLYGLIAIGFVLIFKATDVPNFAQGEILMISAYFGYILHSAAKLPYLLVFLLTILFAALFGIFIERIAYRSLIRRPIFSIILATIAVGIILRSGARFVWGDDVYVLPPMFSISPIALGTVSITPMNLSVLGVSILFIIVLYLFFRFTTLGKAMRATQQNKNAASLMGIRVERIFALTWAISSIFGAVAGIMLAPLILISPDMGWVAIKGFAAAILGGFSSLPGALLGGLILGITETLAGGFISSALKDIVSFVILIGILIVRPSGLLGKPILTGGKT